MPRITDDNFRNYVIEKSKEMGLLYENAENQVKAIMDATLNKSVTASTKKQATVKIEAILATTAGEVSKILTTITPVTYKAALEKVKKELPARLSAIPLSPAHAIQVTNLIDTAYADFASGLEGVNKAAGKALTQAQTTQIANSLATGVSEGEGIKKIAKGVQEGFGKNGFTAFVAKDGKKMPLKWYSEMLTRTHLTKTNYTSFVTRMKETNIDIVQMSSHSGACERCIPFQGRIYSLSGSGGLPQAPSLPLHPQCRHQYQARPDLAIDDSEEIEEYNDTQEKRAIKQINSTNISDNAKAKAVKESKTLQNPTEQGTV